MAFFASLFASKNRLPRLQLPQRGASVPPILTERGRVKVTFKGRSESLSVRNSEFYAKQGGKWRCVFQQVTRIAEPPGENR